MWAQAHRGFESHPLRQFPPKFGVSPVIFWHKLAHWHFRHYVAHLTQEEETILLDACQRPAWLRPLVITAIETGMRMGELLSLTWPDIAADYAHVRDSKNGEARHVPLSQRARDTLTAWQIAQGKAGRPFPIGHTAVEQAYRPAVQAVAAKGVPRVTFHDLRHVAATRLAQRLTPLELARTLGHKTMAMRAGLSVFPAP
ncbi:MAG: site-specific integrase [Magnetospirillum sp.]|nr:site-specific integrase [Magnetospirillum sp.]